MRISHVFARAALVAFAAGALVGPSSFALAQSADKPTEQKSDPAKDSAAKEAQSKETQKKIDEIAEAGRTMSGPAGNAECVWLGRRVVSLLWRDDLDTAFRHLDVYDRFGCPGGHVQATFRCVVKQGPIDPKQQDTLTARVHACWLNPTEPAAAATAAQAPAPEGTTTR